MKTKFASAKKSGKKENTSSRSNSPNSNNTGPTLYMIHHHFISNLALDCFGIFAVCNCFDRLNTDDDSDNEPVSKIAKVSSKAAKTPPKRSVNTKKKGTFVVSTSTERCWSLSLSHRDLNTRCYYTEAASADDDSLDDEPLSETAKKLKSRRQPKRLSRKESPVMKSQRTAARKIGGCEMRTSKNG